MGLKVLDFDKPNEIEWEYPSISDKPVVRAQKEGIKICDDFWDDFIGLARAFYKFRPETDFYDIFNFIREQNGGTSYSVDFLEMIDGEVEREYQKELKRGIRY